MAREGAEKGEGPLAIRGLTAAPKEGRRSTALRAVSAEPLVVSMLCAVWATSCGE